MMEDDKFIFLGMIWAIQINAVQVEQMDELVY